MNTEAIIPKINIQGSTSNEPLISFIQNYRWNTSNYCLLTSNGYSYLNGVIINGDDNYNNIYVNSNNLIFGINNNDNNNFIFSINSNERIRINSNGYMGINNNDPQYHLDIKGSLNYFNDIFKNNVNLDNIYLNIRNNFWVSDNARKNIFIDINSNINNVGIGTSFPLTTLHIGSTVTDNDSSIMISKNNNLNFKIGYDNNNFIIGNSNILANSWNRSLSINSNAPTNSLFIDNVGNIGINTNITNNFKLNVNGTLNATSLRGIGSNLSNLDYSNITINRPELSNLNNWIFNPVNNTIFNNQNNIGIGIGTTTSTFINIVGSTTTRIDYKLNINGAFNSSEIRLNNIDINNIYISSNYADNRFLKISNYDWNLSSSGNEIINVDSNLKLKDKYALIIGNNINNINVANSVLNPTLCYIFGNLYSTTLTGNGANITSLDYNNITLNKPSLLLTEEARLSYLSITNFNTYSNLIRINYATINYVDTQLNNFNASITNLIGGNIDGALINAIAGRLNDTQYVIDYKKIIFNPVDIHGYNDTTGGVIKLNSPSNINTFGFNTYADNINSNNIITVGGNIVSLNNIISYGNIQENRSNLSNIYISSNVYNSNIIYYDKIVDRKLSACTPNNYYPPSNYQYNIHNSNVINNSRYGNGIYEILTSTSYRNIEIDNFNNQYGIGKVPKSYQLFNTSNTSNNLSWELGNLSATNANIGYYSSFFTNNASISAYYFTEDIQEPKSNVTRYTINNVPTGLELYGHWLQYYYSEGLILNNIEFYITNIEYSPRKIILLGTNEFVPRNYSETYLNNWDIILFDYIINDNKYLSISTYPFSHNYPSNYKYCTIPLPANVSSYKYYRIIITELHGGSFISLNQVKFNGVEVKKEWLHSGTNIYSYSNISINTIDNISPYKLNVNGLIYSSSNIYANTNIGIGTTSPLANLHIGSTNSISDGTIMISKNDSSKNVNLKIGYDNNYNFILGNYNVNTNFWNSQFIINSNATSNSILIDNNGNIGINTNINNSIFKLNINGSTIINNGIINQSNNILSSSIRNNFYNDIFASNNIIASNIITSNFTANQYSTFSNILSCLSNVGIGITNNFNGTLHINTNINSNGFWNASANLGNNNFIREFIGKNNNNNNGFYRIYNHISDNDNRNYLSYTTSNYYPIFNLTTNCNIGIGITDPIGLFQIGNGGKFRINSNDNSTAIFGLNNNDNSSNTKIFLNISNIEYYASSNNGTHRFYTSNSENLRIDFNGNVGIGTTNTTNYKLYVNGNTYITSNLYLNSNIGVGTTNPIANIHINNGSFQLNNFRFGNNNNISNLIIGSCNVGNNTWISQIIINSNASSNSLIISSNNFIGINNSNPIANLHIGDINKQSSTFIISQNNRNFRIGYDNNNNFIFGDFGNTNNNSLNNWNSQFIINSNATSNSLIIDNNGNIGINTNTNNNNYKLNINGNIIQNGNLNNFFNGNLGIGTANNENYRLNVIGEANISSKLYSLNIYNTNTLVQKGNVRIGSLLEENSFPGFHIYIKTPATCIDGPITFSNSTFQHFDGTATFNSTFNHSNGIATFNSRNVTINSPTNINSNLTISNSIFQHSGGTATFNSTNLQINSPTTITSNLTVMQDIKENNSNLSDIYVKLQNLSNLSVNNLNIKKKYGYIFTMPPGNLFTYNNITYNAYNIDLTKISKSNRIGTNSFKRLFNFKCFSTEDNLENFNSGFPNILQYDVYMSSNTTTNNINICAIGTPENYLLSNILPTNISLIRCTTNNNFNYLSIVSPPNTSICYMIEDYLS